MISFVDFGTKDTTVIDADNFGLVSYNTHKGMSPLNAKVALVGMAQALDVLAPVFCAYKRCKGKT